MSFREYPTADPYCKRNKDKFRIMYLPPLIVHLGTKVRCDRRTRLSPVQDQIPLRHSSQYLRPRLETLTYSLSSLGRNYFGPTRYECTAQATRRYRMRNLNASQPNRHRSTDMRRTTFIATTFNSNDCDDMEKTSHPFSNIAPAHGTNTALRSSDTCLFSKAVSQHARYAKTTR